MCLKKMFYARLVMAIILGIALVGFGCAAPEATPTPTKVVTWKFQSVHPPPEEVLGTSLASGYGQYCKFAKAVEEKTNGGLII